MHMYVKYIKRILDVFFSLIALIVLSPVLLGLVVVGAVVMRGNPFFVQLRPGRIDPKTGQETLFRMIKLRTMDNRRNQNGDLLPDSIRLNRYGRFLRSTSLDELPELINILLGDMSIVGPRPQLVRDMVFMTPRQRRRHTVRQGLTGLAQVSGRNSISWDKKLELDLYYIDNITFMGDVRIVLQTFVNVFKRDGITEEGLATAMDYGDHLLNKGAISRKEYEDKQQEAETVMRSAR